MSKYKFFCDLEFTNTDPMNGQILEAAMVVTDSNLNVLGEFHAKVRPTLINSTTWTMAAQEVHKTTPQMAMAHPLSRHEFCINLLWFLRPYYDDVNEIQDFVCHAMSQSFFDKKSKSMSWPLIDYHMLEWAFRYEELYNSFIKIFTISKVTSTMDMAKKAGLVGVNPKTNRKSYKLNLLCEKIGFELDHHKALSDTYGCLAIYRHCTSIGSLL